MKKRFQFLCVVWGSLVLFSQASAAVEYAKVNGKAITNKDLELALSNLNEGQKKQVLADPVSRRQVLVSVIDQELLAQQAEKEKVDQDPQFKETINGIRKQLLATRLMEKNLATKVTDAAAKKFYEDNRYRFTTDQIHVQHILVSDMDKAKALLVEAKKEGADFQAMAEKESRDPSAKNNRGDLGFVGRDRLVAEFTEAAFGAKVGEVIGPVKTAYGYHLIRVVEKKAGKTLNYDEVELRVKNELRQKLLDAYVSQLKTTAKIQVDDKTVDKP